jgi:hypothetical protein
MEYMTPPDFVAFPSIARYSRDCTITEKIDGSNAQVHVTDDGRVLAGSRNQWIGPDGDNFGFARWVEANRECLLTLGPGTHYGEWWGSGIQRRYGLTGDDKRFSLFNSFRWSDEAGARPACCDVVPVLLVCEFTTENVLKTMEYLRESGSFAAPGFMKPEGVVIYHHHAKAYFKKTFDGDLAGKSYGA